MIANLGGDQLPLGGDIILTVEGMKAEAANLTKIRSSSRANPPVARSR